RDLGRRRLPLAAARRSRLLCHPQPPARRDATRRDRRGGGARIRRDSHAAARPGAAPRQYRSQGPAQPQGLDLHHRPAKASELFLIDGTSLAYRAYYALPEELATTDGFPTNALLGFANMLMRLLGDYRPRGVVVAWDERPTHRLERFPGYKASRKPSPD